MSSGKRKPNLWIKVFAFARKNCDYETDGTRFIPLIKEGTRPKTKYPKDIERDGRKLYKLASDLYNVIKQEDYHHSSTSEVNARLNQILRDMRSGRMRRPSSSRRRRSRRTSSYSMMSSYGKKHGKDSSSSSSEEDEGSTCGSCVSCGMSSSRQQKRDRKTKKKGRRSMKKVSEDSLFETRDFDSL